MRKIAIIGAGESGVGAAILAKQKGYTPWVSDAGKISTEHKQTLTDNGIAWEEGGHTAEEIFAAEEIIKSPGVPPTVPLIVEAVNRGIPITSEIEFAGRYTQAKMICITGSNGKTTTTLLTHHILRTAGYNVGLAGNVGRSFALQVAEGEHDYYVLELSSFQLENMYQFRANVAILLNITADHLDRYDYKIENYAAAKFRIMQNQTAQDAFIYWQADPIISEHLNHISTPAQVLPFADQAGDVPGYIDGKTLVFNHAGKSFRAEKMSLRGRHNMYNCLAAGLAALQVGVAPDAILEGLRTFTPVEHRLQYIDTVDGIEYINDSKATNVDACRYAIESMDRPTVLILGGLDKGNDYSLIEDLVKERVKALVFLGVDNSKLHAFFDGKVPLIADARSMPECLAHCREFAQAGDAVLLSPCCASFDLFRNMEDRGEQFIHGVQIMKNNNPN